jgi:hypothetical protein
VTRGVIDLSPVKPYLIGMIDDRPGGPAAIREARLRPAAADRVRWAPAGVWLPASTLAATALRQAGETGEFDPRARALDGDTFEFRGGRPEAARRTPVRTRRSDHPTPAYGIRQRRVPHDR